MEQSTGVRDGCARLLDFAESYPPAYELLFRYGYLDRATPALQAAEFSLFEGHMRRVGVRERKVRPTALAVATLLHGAARFRLAHEAPNA
ncbi:hypothetical protein BH11PSE3_BH11PSE3_15970 [soil metagenome]